MTFEESGGVTTMKILIRYSSRDHRDATIASAWRRLQTSLDQLEELVRQPS